MQLGEVIENGNSWYLVNVTTPSDWQKSTAHAWPMDTSTTATSIYRCLLQLRALMWRNEASNSTQLELLQRLVSRLAILGVVTPPEDLNVKFLRSLPSEWDTHWAKSSIRELEVRIFNEGSNTLDMRIFQRLRKTPGKMASFAFSDSEEYSESSKSDHRFGIEAENEASRKSHEDSSLKYNVLYIKEVASDLHTCAVAAWVLGRKTKEGSKALSIQAWVEAMQELPF
ncbi:hypothetical protein Tco_0717182 [Tanacetum coccineum]